MKLVRMVLHTPSEDLEIELEENQSEMTKEEFNDLLTEWGRILSGKVKDDDGNVLNLEHFKFPLSENEAAVFPTQLLQNSFITMETE